MSRIQALLTAGALTGLVIVAIFWYGTGNSAAAVTTALTAESANITVPDKPTASDMQSLLEQNRELRETVTTLLNREAQYRRQIEAANQQLLASQTQPATSGDRNNGQFYEDDDDHEDRDDRYEVEQREHDGYEEHDEDD